MNPIDHLSSVVKIDNEFLKFRIGQKNGFEHRQKLKKTNKSLFNMLNLLPFSLISAKHEYCKNYYGYEQNKNDIIKDSSILVKTQFVSYEYEKYLNNENHKNFVYDTKRLKNNKISIKSGTTLKKSRPYLATSEIKNSELSRETRKLKRSMKKCTINSLNLSLEKILSDFKISNITRRFVQTKLLETKMVKIQDGINKNIIELNELELPPSVVTLTDDDFDKDKKCILTRRFSNDFENISPNSSTDYFNNNFFAGDDQSFKIFNTTKSLQFVNNFKADSVYNSSDDEKSDQSFSNITMTDFSLNIDNNDSNFLSQKDNYKVVKNSPSKFNVNLKGGKYEKFVLENKFTFSTKQNSVKSKLPSVNIGPINLSPGEQLKTRTIINVNAFDSDISPNVSHKLTHKISPFKISSYEKFIKESKKAQSKIKKTLLDDRNANSISTYLKNHCAISSYINNNIMKYDEISDYDKIEVIDLT